MKKHSVLVRRLWAAAAILVVLFIWSNSLRNADRSTVQSDTVLTTLAPFLKDVPKDTIRLPRTLIRKAAHITEFAALGLTLCAALSAPARRYRRAAVMALTLSSLIASSDELIQRFVPGRSGQLSDVCLDMLGAALGILLYLGVKYFLGSVRKRNTL